MCGITGALAPGTTAEEWPRLLTRMAGAISHRGPDDHGSWFDADAGAGLGHRRLSILDLSPEGHQPMSSASGRFVICYNGEVYNYEALRKQLASEGKAPAWRGHSDTEVILAAIEAWGVAAAVPRLVGIFAFAIWDRRERSLHLVRDHVGVKPLYYSQVGSALLFGSELKALRAHPAFVRDIDRDAMVLYLRHMYIGAPHSIYRHVRKLPPGCILSARYRDGEPQPRIEISEYWSLRTAVEAGVRNPLDLSDAEALEALDALLRDAVAGQMMSDVPLGAFLSGGIDSSTVVALMQAHSSRPVKTFSIGFREATFDEAPHARAVATHLKTDHTELYVTPEDGLAVIPRLPHVYDEPFADSSQIPTLLLSELTRRHVTVSLSGDGGDELFCGYGRYFTEQRVWPKLGWIPGAGRRALAALLRGTAPLLPWQAPMAQPDGYSKLSWSRASMSMLRLAEMLAEPSEEGFYLQLISVWRPPTGLVIGATEPPSVYSDATRWAGVRHFMQHMMYTDSVAYLPDDILVKVDRASMAVGLEARVPLLDHRVVEFAQRLPMHQRARGRTGKWLLRQLLYRHVPRELVERPKMGFGVPLDTWLRGPLRDWAEALLARDRLEREGIFRPAPIRQRWTEHLSGTRDWSFPLWVILMLQAWLEHERTGAGDTAGRS